MVHGAAFTRNKPVDDRGREGVNVPVIWRVSGLFVIQEGNPGFQPLDEKSDQIATFSPVRRCLRLTPDMTEVVRSLVTSHCIRFGESPAAHEPPCMECRYVHTLHLFGVECIASPFPPSSEFLQIIRTAVPHRSSSAMSPPPRRITIVTIHGV